MSMSKNSASISDFRTCLQRGLPGHGAPEPVLQDADLSRHSVVVITFSHGALGDGASASSAMTAAATTAPTAPLRLRDRAATAGSP